MTEWDKLWLGINDLVTDFGDRLVFIGGVAVYLHIVGNVEGDPSGLIEFSHDGDFMISLTDFSELRDVEEVTRNPKLSKYQIIKHDIDFDVYLENRNDLLVPFNEAYDESDVVNAPILGRGVRVASCEHLLALKADAYRDRKNSAKGTKDERDLIRIVYAMRSDPKKDLVIPYLTAELRDLLESVKRSSQFLVLMNKNAHKASQLRQIYVDVIDRILE